MEDYPDNPPIENIMMSQEEPLTETPSDTIVCHPPDGPSTRKKYGMIYEVQETPPWYLCFIFSFQHYLLIISGVALPLIITEKMCLGDDLVGRSEVVGTSLFVEGVTTLLQTTFGTRLPIIQGASLSYFVPTLSILSLPQWDCPQQPDYLNGTELLDWRLDVWTTRMREIQGATIAAGAMQMAIGLSGALGLLLRFISPVCIATVLTLLGLSPMLATVRYSATHWGIAFMLVALVTIFSQYLRDVNVPFPGCKRGKGCIKINYPIFKLIPVMAAIVITWLFCFVLTVTNVLPDDPSQGYGYEARTDIKLGALREARWFRFPYPGQWGMPTISLAAALGMMAGAWAGMLESVGDYNACAEISGAPPPPRHAVNRGIMMEGLGVMIGGALGSASGVTSNSGSIGAVSITKVGSRRVMQWCGAVVVTLGLLAKFGAIFVAIPQPVIGGIFTTVFGIIIGLGVSTLRYADMSSSRNLYIYGLSVFVGISGAVWMSGHPNAIRTGWDAADRALTVICSIAFFLGGVLAFFLDNTVPGTPKERGLLNYWSGKISADDNARDDVTEVYGLPYVTKWLERYDWTRFIPVCPTFVEGCFRGLRRNPRTNRKGSRDGDSPYCEVGAKDEA